MSQTPVQNSTLRAFKAVAASFFGVRKSSQAQQDMAGLSPFHVIAVGIVTCLVFVAGLIVLVNWVVAK